MDALRELEQLGLVRRDQSPQDKRKIDVFLTERGNALCTAILPDVEEFNQRLVRSMSADEQVSLHNLLRQMRQNLKR